LITGIDVVSFQCSVFCHFVRLLKAVKLKLLLRNWRLLWVIHPESNAMKFNTRLTAIFPGLPGWASTRKVKPICISLKQETVSGSGIGWAICKSAHCPRQITTPAPHQSVFYFLRTGCPSCRPTESEHWKNILRPCITIAECRHDAAKTAAWFYPPSHFHQRKREEMRRVSKTEEEVFDLSEDVVW